MPAELARAILLARRTVGLTQKQLGMRLGLKGRAVYRWERGDSLPSRRHRHALIQAIRAVNVEAADKLAEAFGHALNGGAREAAAAAPPPRVANPATFERALFAMADELDLAPRRVRVALCKWLERAHEAGYSLEAALAQVVAWMAPKVEESADSLR